MASVKFADLIYEPFTWFGAMSESQQKKAVTVSEAAAFLGVSPATLRNWDRAGKIKTFRHHINGYRLYPMDQLKEIKNLICSADFDVHIIPSEFSASPRRPAQEADDLGQHMTPPAIARQMANFVQKHPSQWTVLDPACGDGNLLLAAAEQMIQAGTQKVEDRLIGIEIDEKMASVARERLAEKIGVDVSKVKIYTIDFLQHINAPLFSDPEIDLHDVNVIISNPPYGRGREYAFFDGCASKFKGGAELVFLVPLSFIDRVEGVLAVPLEGRPLGVTTGHAIVRHVNGELFHIRSVKENQKNLSLFKVLSGIKLYEVGAGIPPQTKETVDRKPFSSAVPQPNWIPCLRTGDIQPFSYTVGRMYIQYGSHLAHPKEISRFQGPRLFVRRVPIWQNRQLGAVYIEETVLCAGDILVVRHELNDIELLKGLCVYLNSPEAAELVLQKRPSLRFRDSFPKLSAKDLNALLDNNLPSDDELRTLGRKNLSAPGNKTTSVFNPQVGQAPDPESRFVEFHFPVTEVSESCAREKSIRQGHISTLQLWWARRPLAVCRSAIFASLIPHPDALDKNHPWLNVAEQLLPGTGPLITRLNSFIARLSEWESAEDFILLDSARMLIKAAYPERPLLVDSFAGGGSFPLEGLRLGLESIGSDLNPVAVSALKFILECAPNGDRAILDLFQDICAEVNDNLHECAVALYGDNSEGKALAFFWCRTYVCPSCGVEVPLLKDRILAKKDPSIIVEMELVDAEKRYRFSVVEAPSSDQLKSATKGTVSSRGAICPNCGRLEKTDFLMGLGQAGQIGDRLYAARMRGRDGKIFYKTASASDESLANNAALQNVCSRHSSKVPQEELDVNGIRHTWAIKYGVRTTADLYNKRQGISLLEILHQMRVVLQRYEETGKLDNGKNIGVRSLLAFLLNRLAMYSSRHSWWQSSGEFPANMFGRQAIPFVWNYVEMPFSSDGAGGIKSASQWILKAARHCFNLPRAGRAFQADASNTGLAENSVDLVTIDPPYYDSITYGYLADVFYVWMKELLRDVSPEMFVGNLCPKAEEAIVDRPHKSAPTPKGDAHFRRKMAEAFSEITRILKPNGLALVMFGHKSLDAWDAVMTPLLNSGLTPIVSWPIHTERKVKFRHGRIAALSSSCLIVCTLGKKTRKESISWGEFVEQTSEKLGGIVTHYREANHLYGSDLITAMVAPTLSEVGKFAAITEDGRSLIPAEILERLPDIMLKVQLNLILNHPSLQGDTYAKELLTTLTNCNNNVDDFEGRSSITKTIDKFSDALRNGDTGKADRIWLATSKEVREGAQNFLEGISIVAEENSKLGQMAHTCLGRVSLLQRMQGC